MRHRDLLSVREHRAETEAAEKAERARIEAPIRAAEKQLRETHQKLNEAMQERLLARVPDPDRIDIDPRVANVRMSRADAANFNSAEFLKFRQNNPDVFLNEELIDRLGNYFDKNGLGIVTASMIGSLIDRYRDAGLLPDPPAPVPEPEPQPEPVPEPQPETFVGRDLETGGERVYSKREVYLMDAETYRRAFPTLPTMAEVLTAMKTQREQR